MEDDAVVGRVKVVAVPLPVRWAQVQLYVATLVSKFQATGQLGELVGLMQREPRLAELIQGAVDLAEG